MEPGRAETGLLAVLVLIKTFPQIVFMGWGNSLK